MKYHFTWEGFFPIYWVDFFTSLIQNQFQCDPVETSSASCPLMLLLVLLLVVFISWCSWSWFCPLDFFFLVLQRQKIIWGYMASKRSQRSPNLTLERWKFLNSPILIWLSEAKCQQQLLCRNVLGNLKAVAALYHLNVVKHSGWAQLIWQKQFCR